MGCKRASRKIRVLRPAVSFRVPPYRVVLHASGVQRARPSVRIVRRRTRCFRCEGKACAGPTGFFREQAPSMATARWAMRSRFSAVFRCAGCRGAHRVDEKGPTSSGQTVGATDTARIVDAAVGHPPNAVCGFTHRDLSPLSVPDTLRPCGLRASFFIVLTSSPADRRRWFSGVFHSWFSVGFPAEPGRKCARLSVVPRRSSCPSRQAHRHL